jgi:hypothetical protein
MSFYATDFAAPEPESPYGDYFGVQPAEEKEKERKDSGVDVEVVEEVRKTTWVFRMLSGSKGGLVDYCVLQG